jgi:predicted lipid-binding transport protein (Tim44 family)
MFAAAQRKIVDPRLGGQSLVMPIFLTAAVLVAASLASAPALAAQSGGSEHPGNNLQPLWKGYPLNPGAGRIGSTPTKRTVDQPARQTRPAPADSDNGGGSSPAVPLAAAGGFLLLGVLAAFLVFLRSWAPLSSTKGARMSRFSGRRSRRQDVTAAPEKKEPVAERPEGEPAQAEAERHEVEPAEASSQPAWTAVGDQTAPANEPGRFGEHVETVLRAAEDAAARVIQLARAQAEELRAAAEREAASRLEAAEAEANGLRSEAEQVRAAAQRDIARERAQLEEEAAKMRADAEREASRASAAAERYEEVLSDTALAEDRLRRLVGRLREVADRLDGLLVAPTAATSADATDGKGDAPDEATLVESLDPSKTEAGVGTRGRYGQRCR